MSISERVEDIKRKLNESIGKLADDKFKGVEELVNEASYETEFRSKLIKIQKRGTYYHT